MTLFIFALNFHFFLVVEDNYSSIYSKPQFMYWAKKWAAEATRKSPKERRRNEQKANVFTFFWCCCRCRRHTDRYSYCTYMPCYCHQMTHFVKAAHITHLYSHTLYDVRASWIATPYVFCTVNIWKIGLFYSEQRTYLRCIVFVCRSGSRRDQPKARKQKKEKEEKERQKLPTKGIQACVYIWCVRMCLFVDVLMAD